eukprot:2187603-Rhodomonas_salina.1
MSPYQRRLHHALERRPRLEPRLLHLRVVLPAPAPHTHTHTHVSASVLSPAVCLCVCLCLCLSWRVWCVREAVVAEPLDCGERKRVSATAGSTTVLAVRTSDVSTLTPRRLLSGFCLCVSVWLSLFLLSLSPSQLDGSNSTEDQRRGGSEEQRIRGCLLYTSDAADDM